MKFCKKFVVALLMLLVIPPVTLSQDNQVSSTALATQEEVYPISNSDQPPHNIVGKIVYDDGYSGTGFVIGHNTILTNRHMVQDLNTHSGEFKLGLNQHNNGPQILGEYKLISAKLAPNEHDDVAILTVKPKQDNLPLDKVVAPAKLVNANYIDEQWMLTDENKMHTAGYPGNRQRNVMWGSNGKLLKYGFNNNRIYVANIDTAPGASGSPLFNKDNEVVGINSSSYGPPTNESGGFLFKDDLYDFIINNR